MAAGPLAGVLDALDLVLAAAVASTRGVRGAEPDPFLGLHLGIDDVGRDLAREPGTPAYALPCGALFDSLREDPRFAALALRFELTRFDAATLALALAPEFDVRYERIVAFLQNDLTRPRPTPALALDLFTADAAEREWALHRFAPTSPLISARLLDVRGRDGATRLSSALIVDSQIGRCLLGEDGVDPALAPWCRLTSPADAESAIGITAGDFAALEGMSRSAVAAGEPLTFHFRGPHGTGKHLAASALAARLERRLLAADLRGAAASGAYREAIRRLLREAELQDAVLFLHGYDGVAAARQHQVLRELASQLTDTSTIAIVAGGDEWCPAGSPPWPVVPVAFGVDDPDVRQAAWRVALADAGVELPSSSVRQLSEPLRITSAQIAAAVSSAVGRRAWSAQQSGAAAIAPTVDDLLAAARAQTGRALSALAHRIVPRRTWSDLVLPDETLQVLREVGERVVHRRRVLADWGFNERLSLGKGTTALFAGPSGTGKTLAAEVLAADLGLDLFRIDLANVVSKYIGETEKNLDRVFAAAEDANAVLLFDEAEALFGKRTEVHDAHDRYANLEIAYLLQKMDEFDGLAILSTNLRQNIDDAFTRRLTFTVHFPFPEEAERRRIWTIVWPERTPRAADLDAAALARELMLSGGHIRNAALAAAFYAAADGGIVTRSHVLRAARRELQKMGKVFAAEARA